MLTVIEGRPLELRTFVQRDEELTPDEGSVSISVTKLDGTSIVASGEDTTNLALLLDTSTLPVDFGELFTVYKLKVDYTFNQEDKTYYDLIRVIKDLPITIEAQTVRNILGVTEDELSDEDLDIYSYYVKLTEDLALDIFSDLTRIQTANDLLAYYCAYNELDSLSLKILYSFQVDDHRRTRFSNIDLNQLSLVISQRYWQLRGEFDSSGGLPQEPLVSFGTRTDVITGN